MSDGMTFKFKDKDVCRKVFEHVDGLSNHWGTVRRYGLSDEITIKSDYASDEPHMKEIIDILSATSDD